MPDRAPDAPSDNEGPRLREAERRQRVLADATAILLDYVGPDEIEPLRRIVDKVTAVFGDWCAFSLVDKDGILRQVRQILDLVVILRQHASDQRSPTRLLRHT